MSRIATESPRHADVVPPVRIPLSPPHSSTRRFLRAIPFAKGPISIAIFNSSYGRLTSRIAPLFSERLASLQTSGLHRFRTILEIRTFRATYESRWKVVRSFFSDGREGPISTIGFQSTISRFESSRPSQTVRQPDPSFVMTGSQVRVLFAAPASTNGRPSLARWTSRRPSG